MNSRHRATLREIFSEPAPRTLEFRRMEALLVALGCRVIEGDGSRVGFVLGGRRLDLHRPHPAKEAKRYQAQSVRDFLEKLEIRP